MRCPSCKNPMAVLELENVEIDHCFSCGGIWLDAGELELLMGGPTGKECLLVLFEACEMTKEKSIKCPICLKKMKKVLYGNEAKKIRLDKCETNDGIWFDRGELNEVIEIGSKGRDDKVVNLLKDMFAGQINKKEV